ncbi:MAG: DNA-processing protein DprA [Gemmatimonadales bacterium]
MAAIRVIACGSAGYPASLEDLPQPPSQLFAIGDLSAFDAPLVSIVGTREPTPYGLRTARALAGALARAGVNVVSGMARGIDSVAHRAALEGGQKTIAVLGTGVDVPYPVGHRELHRVIGERGLVISESGSGARAHKGVFPRRNRIIAALGKLTIVVEAGHKSGALNTASHALDLGRPVAAVPGPIDSPQSEGTNRLIRDGALAISSIADVLALAGVDSAGQAEPVQLSGADALVWSALGGETMIPDSIAVRTMLSTRECLTAITSLELMGMVECLITGEVRRR